MPAQMPTLEEALLSLAISPEASWGEGQGLSGVSSCRGTPAATGGGHHPWPLRRAGGAKRDPEDQRWSPLLSLCRLIELHSPDSRNTLILRCKDTATAHSWFMAIHTNIMALLPQVLAELNAMLGASHAPGSSREVKQIAWLAEQVSPSPTSLIGLAFLWLAAGGR